MAIITNDSEDKRVINNKRLIDAVERTEKYHKKFLSILGLLLNNSLNHNIGSEDIPDDKVFNQQTDIYNEITPLVKYQSTLDESEILITKYLIQFLGRFKNVKSVNNLDGCVELFDEIRKRNESVIIQPVYSKAKVVVGCVNNNGSLSSISMILLLGNMAIFKLNETIYDMIKEDISYMILRSKFINVVNLVFEFDIDCYGIKGDDEINSFVNKYFRLRSKEDLKYMNYKDDLNGIVVKNITVFDNLFNVVTTSLYKDVITDDNFREFVSSFNIIKFNNVITKDFDKLPIRDYKLTTPTICTKTSNISASDKYYITEVLGSPIIKNSNIISTEIICDGSSRVYLDRPLEIEEQVVKNILLNNNYNNGVSISIIIDDPNESNPKKRGEIILPITDKYTTYKVLLGYITIGSTIYFHNNPTNLKNRIRYKLFGNLDVLDINLTKVRSFDNFDVFKYNLDDQDIVRKYNLDPELKFNDYKNITKLKDLLTDELSLDIANKIDLSKNIFDKSQYRDLLRIYTELDLRLLPILKTTFINAIYSFNDKDAIFKILSSLILGKLVGSLIINIRLLNLIRGILLYSNINITHIINSIYVISKYDIDNKLNLYNVQKYLIEKYGLSLVDQVIGLDDIIEKLISEDNADIIDELSNDSHNILDSILLFIDQSDFIDNWNKMIKLIKEKIE